MRSTNICDFMVRDVHIVDPEMDIYDAVDFLLEKKISGAPVIEAGRLVGLVSEKDCLRLLATGENHEHAQGCVRDFMTTSVETIPPDMDVHFAAGLFLARPFRRFPVVEHDRLVGQISRRDILRAIQVMRAKVNASARAV